MVGTGWEQALLLTTYALLAEYLALNFQLTFPLLLLPSFLLTHLLLSHYSRNSRHIPGQLHIPYVLPACSPTPVTHYSLVTCLLLAPWAIQTNLNTLYARYSLATHYLANKHIPTYYRHGAKVLLGAPNPPPGLLTASLHPHASLLDALTRSPPPYSRPTPPFLAPRATHRHPPGLQPHARAMHQDLGADDAAGAAAHQDVERFGPAGAGAEAGQEVNAGDGEVAVEAVEGTEVTHAQGGAGGEGGDRGGDGGGVGGAGLLGVFG